MPQITSHIFNRKKIHSLLKNKTVADLAGEIAPEKINSIIGNWQTLIKKGVLDRKNEISLQDAFLKNFFCQILQYQNIANSPEEWFFEREKGTKSDGTRSDGALGFFTSGSENGVRVAVELKSAKIGLDQKIIRKSSSLTPVEQAFMYASKFGKQCKWVIVSNYKELRFYNSSSMNEFEVFEIENLDKEDELKKFLYLLYRDRLIKKDGDSTIDLLFLENEAEQEKISKVFYNQYQQIRIHLFEHLKGSNPAVDELVLLEKSQKILDRFIFVCFCEDTGLLPERIFRKVLDAVKSNGLMVKICAWDQIRGLFRSIDEGNPPHNINRYNGGLFAYDALLDGQLILKEEMIIELAELTNYDFESDLNVNILGHIFEQSIADIEELKSFIAGEDSDKKKGKRKKEGIYYTPEYITRYIVDQAVGGWLRDRREDLGFGGLPELTEKDYESIKILKKGTIKSNKNVKKHLEFWEAYKQILSNIKILDPACGSGAFLNQSFDYLFKEGQSVNQQIADLKGGQLNIFGLDKHILKHNLFGVDLNPESVEITKLSLWLKTANNKSELTALDDNILCGNSLVADPTLAGTKAFKWGEMFSEVMKNGGFDVVIGNPPYVDSENMVKNNPAEREYISNNYKCAKGNWDLFVVFIEKGFSLLKQSGHFSMIIPNKLLSAPYAKDVRNFIVSQNTLTSIVDVTKENVFEIDVYPVIITGLSGIFKRDLQIKIGIAENHGEKFLKNFNIPENWALLLGEDNNLLKKTKNLRKLKDISNVYSSATVSEAYELKENIEEKCNANRNKIINTGTIDPYISLWGYTPMNYIKGKYLFPYIDINKLKKTKEWFPKDKIIVAGMALKIEACYSNGDEFFPAKSTTTITQKSETMDLKYILSLLNSKLLNYFFKKANSQLSMAGGYMNINKNNLGILQVPEITKSQQRPFIERASVMLSLNRDFYKGTGKFIKFIDSSFNPKCISIKIKEFYNLDFGAFIKELKRQKVSLPKKDEYELMELFESEKKKALNFKNQINQIDFEINQMVYELYSLTKEEIQVIENSQ